MQVVHYEGKPVEVYRYNRMGQRVFSQVSGGQPLKYNYNEQGQLVQVGEVSYSYDEDGYLAAKQDSDGLTRYHYLESGQLCGVLLPDGREIEYRFDENGFRVEKLINGKQVQRYQWDNLITLSAVEDSSGVILIRYDEDKGFFEKVHDGVEEALTKGGKAAKEATAKAADIFQGQGDDAMKYGKYVSPEKREFCNTMMDYTKKTAIQGARRGFKKYNAVGGLLAPVTVAGGMLTGTVIGISNMNNKE